MSLLATRLKSAVVALSTAAALAACGGGGGSGSTGGGGGGFVPGTPTPGATATPTPGATATPTPASTATPTPAPTATPTPAATPGTIVGKVVDAGTGNPIGGLTVAVEAALAANNAAMAGSSAPAGSLTAVTATDGTFSIPNTLAAPNQTNFYLDVYGAAAYANNSFHGQFYPGGKFGPNGGAMSATGVSNIGTLKLTNPTVEEVSALAQINAFRAAPGPIGGPTYPQYGVSATVVFDENLIETGAYWATELHTYWNSSWTVGDGSGGTHDGHHCAGMNNPPGCVEFDAFLLSLPGTPPSGGAGQNIAFNATGWNGGTTSYANQFLEAEGSYCAPNPWNYAVCPSQGAVGQPGQTGHFIGIMTATKWAGFGEAKSGYSEYVQQFQ